MDGYIIGIDLGGMSAKAAIFDKEGKILSKKTVETNAAEGFAGTAAKLAELAEELCRLNRQRQQVESEIYAQAVAMLDGQANP